MADTYANKYLDGVGLAHLWEKIKAQSAKIALVGSTGSTWEKILLQESDEEDKKYIKWLLSAEQDVMIEDVSDNNRRYYYVKQEKGDYERLDYIWESYSSSKIYRITVKGDSLALTLTKEEFPYEDQYGYAINTYVAGAYIDDNKNKIHFIDGTYNHSTNNLEVEVNNTGGTLIFNDKVGNKTLTFDVASYVAGEVGKIDQFKYVISTGAANTPKGVTWYKETGTQTTTKIEGTLTPSANTEFIIYLVPMQGGSSTVDKNVSGVYVEYLTINTGTSSSPAYSWEKIGTTKTDLSDYQPLDADLTAIAGLTGGGLLKRNSNDTWSLDTTAYAGGTAVTLNSTSKAGSTASFYAPTAAGTSGQILKSSGSGAPTWVNQSTLSVGSATKATQDGNGNNIASTYVPKTSSSNEAQANITNENGEVSITSAESGVSVVPEGAALFSATQDGMNVLSVNDKGAFFNDGNKDYRIVDYSMTLTTGEIDIICADN